MSVERRDKNRDFSERVKCEERISANNCCRICGDNKGLEFAHIYSNSKNKQWIRKGSDDKVNNDDFVSSIDNCLLLCHIHHSKIDSVLGLQMCDVNYLSSLKTSQSICTAIVASKVRCKMCNTRIKDGNYRCRHHREGGLENGLPNRTFVRKQEIIQESKSYCSIL